jgi:hypothetical protein
MFFLKKNIARVLQVCEIPKDFALYFKNIRNYFGKKIYYSLLI